jgi:transposase-like protein
MKNTRTRHSVAFKAKVALEAIAGNTTVPELARRYRLHPTQIFKWKKEFVENAARAFEKDGGACRDEGGADREAELLKKIGELTIERDFLSKGLARIR